MRNEWTMTLNRYPQFSYQTEIILSLGVQTHHQFAMKNTFNLYMPNTHLICSYNRTNINMQEGYGHNTETNSILCREVTN